ncbi:pyruvate kinase [Rhodospirillum rubrum]|uniref:Pyruvate kinase n=1 Tax=Rhodospirillum rubrum (strain ATCC 11170 / ATH 1.1.1 / DSM 467 / LMG 4362 / NCIMB 8255 / S1) TaxID=269796 RepID=Q2RRI0_RHORT|nr:pyruvate kinase [Rhodospirillum rubrum]ABC23265.1 pyruvate kinase [Rhodospirillum rubrum ATCC 11170]AEO48997.1 pyruvate kinase [Rhodospirillum rubrum F11]MBK5954935.1 pyruvate kinase [Rhodospirillum rubrum]QXG79240.1 pyruvate kinase [Rhodospirillum rubrum]HCF17781.1 pyruvate kinase [Rhodospirillum rubrum]
MKRNRCAKILATLGPATSSESTLETLVRAGADMVRLNFSHGAHEEHRRRYDVVRAVENKLGRPIGILMDLQGPKLRVGDFVGGKVKLETGATFRLDMEKDLGTIQRVRLPHPEIFAAIGEGTDLLLDDGKLRLRVETFGADYAITRVITGGVLSDHKGLNVPNAVLPISALTEKDRRDLQFGLDLGVDWVGLSFVQRPEDVAEARKLIGGRAAIISKIEKPAALDHLTHIIELSDALMVARGDLGVEVPPERVPILQKRILAACHLAGKPVVVATQMLESMINAPTPTRAEASDVATAIYDGADAVMLSAETAVGQYPVEAVAMMDKIIQQVETDEHYQYLRNARRESPEGTAADAISAAASQVAETIKAAAIVTYTSSGSTTLRAARQRPGVPILCLTTNPRIARRMAMVWGVHSVLDKDISNFQEMVELAVKAAYREGFANIGERIVMTAGVPFGTPGTTNVLRIAWVEGDDSWAE